MLWANVISGVFIQFVNALWLEYVSTRLRIAIVIVLFMLGTMGVAFSTHVSFVFLLASVVLVGTATTFGQCVILGTGGERRGRRTWDSAQWGNETGWWGWDCWNQPFARLSDFLAATTALSSRTHHTMKREEKGLGGGQMPLPFHGLSRSAADHTRFHACSHAF